MSEEGGRSAPESGEREDEQGLFAEPSEVEGHRYSRPRGELPDDANESGQDARLSRRTDDDEPDVEGHLHGR